jgi:hypothetical protein
VKDDFDAAHGGRHTLVGPEVSLDHLRVDGLEIRAVAGREVVEQPYVVAPRQESKGKVRSDESGAAGDECLQRD